MTAFSAMASGTLASGAVQFFALDTSGKLWTTWQQSASWNAAWTSPMQSIALPNGVSSLKALQTAALSGGYLQLFVIDSEGEMWTMFHNGSSWSPWEVGFSLP